MASDGLPRDGLFTPVPSPGEVTEVMLLIPAGQLEELERLARGDGLTVAQFLRRHISSLLAARPACPLTPTNSSSPVRP